MYFCPQSSVLLVVHPGSLPWVPALRDTRNNHSFQLDANNTIMKDSSARRREPEPRRAQLFQIINHESRLRYIMISDQPCRSPSVRHFCRCNLPTPTIPSLVALSTISLLARPVKKEIPLSARFFFLFPIFLFLFFIYDFFFFLPPSFGF